MSGQTAPETPGAAEPAAGAKDRTRLATISLHISAIFYVMVGALVALVPLAWDRATEPEYELRAALTWFMAVVSVVLAGLCWALIRGLRRRRRWAWLTSVVLFVLFLPSAFLPLGAMGLFALLGEGTRAQFPVARRDRVRRGA